MFELPVWEKTPAEIDASAETAMAEGDKQLDAIAALSPAESNFASTIAALDNAFYKLLNVSDRIDVIRESNLARRSWPGMWQQASVRMSIKR